MLFKMCAVREYYTIYLCDQPIAVTHFLLRGGVFTLHHQNKIFLPQTKFTAQQCLIT